MRQLIDGLGDLIEGLYNPNRSADATRTAEDVLATGGAAKFEKPASGLPSPEYPWSILYLANGSLLVAHPNHVAILLKKDGTLEFMGPGGGA